MAFSPTFDTSRCGGGAETGDAHEAQVRPVTFGGRFGALHAPAPGTARGITVVICPPVGRDARCAYRPFFLFAEQLAAQGFTVLRYDHLGSGDSMPLDPEADHWPLWLEGVAQAAAFARAHGGGERLVLAGVRLGASLAALAAPGVRPDGLVLLAPIASGRAWVRELQMSAAMVGLDAAEDGSIDIDGLRLSRATIASVQGFDLKKLAPAPAPTLLATPAPDPKLAKALGANVTQAAFEGYAELFLEAHLNAAPERLFEAVESWLDGLAPEAAAAPRPQLAPPPAQLATADWTELPVSFGDGLRGVLSLPARAAGGQGVILGNTGGDPRAGIGGFGARACRALASRGVTALRFDFAGLGESTGERRSHVYEASRTADLVAAAELMASHGCPDPVVAGVCAGGYQALRAAIEEPRFRRVMTINSWLVWRSEMPLSLSRPIFPTRRRINVFALVRPSGWRRLLRGEVKAGEAIATLLHRAARRVCPKRPDAACLTARREIARIAADGARVLVVVGRDDESLDGLEAEFGRRGRWLGRRPGVTVTTVANLDHGLFSVQSQDLALAELFRFLGLDVVPQADLGASADRAFRPLSAAGRQPAL